MTGPSKKQNYWWLVLPFFVPFGLVGTYSSLHTAIKDTRQIHDVQDRQRTQLEIEEDAKEQDVFIRDGSIAGLAGLLLAIAALAVSRRLKRARPPTKNAE